MTTDNSNDINPVDNPDISKTGDDEDFVKYSTYKKTVNEIKNLKSKHAEAIAKLAEYDSREKEKEQARLREDRKYDELLNQKDQELELTRQELNRKTKDIIDFTKTSAFLSAMGNAKIEQKYYNLIPIDEIKLDESGQIDQDSLVNVVQYFKTEHPRLIVEQRGDLPANKPGNATGAKMSVSQWRALGSSKEMREKFHEVDFSIK